MAPALTELLYWGAAQAGWQNPCCFENTGTKIQRAGGKFAKIHLCLSSWGAQFYEYSSFARLATLESFVLVRQAARARADRGFE
jgi:hypothetical protein